MVESTFVGSVKTERACAELHLVRRMCMCSVAPYTPNVCVQHYIVYTEHTCAGLYPIRRATRVAATQRHIKLLALIPIMERRAESLFWSMQPVK